MSTTSTPNYSLVKPTPDTAEPADIAVINGNMDIIDAALDNNANDIDTINTTLTGTNTDVDNLQALNPNSITTHKPIYKETSESRTADTVMNNDADFFFAVEAGKTYWGTVHLRLLSESDAAGDFCNTWSFPDGLFNQYMQCADISLSDGSVSSNIQLRVHFNFDSNEHLQPIACSHTSTYARLDFYYQCEVDGTVHFRWAQNTANADDTLVMQGSYLEYSSVATA